MKKWKIILASILAITVLALVPFTVMAQTQAAPNKRELKGALALVAPRLAIQGQEMQLTVFQRNNQEPVPGVGIWAVGHDQVEALKQALQDLRKNTSPEANKDYTSVLNTFKAKKLGDTGSEGRLKLTFKENGRFLLVAFKKNYLPDFSPLAVKGLPKALAITAPRVVKVGETATITVHQKGSDTAVAGARVWAVPAEKGPDLKATLEAARATNKNDPSKADYASIINTKAISLGVTGVSGQITPKFTAAGKYILVTHAPGYLPAFGALAVVAPNPNSTPTPSAKK